MVSDKILAVMNILEEIKSASEGCLKYNVQSQELIDKIFQNMKETCPASENYNKENLNKVNSEDSGGKMLEELEHLENNLLEKMQENSKLKTLNERLLRSSREKSHKINELLRTVSLQSQRNLMSREVSMYKDKAGKCNVEIQKLKKQLDIETKKLHNEKSKAIRLKNSNASLEKRKKSAEDAKKSPSVMKRSNTSLDGQSKSVGTAKKAASIKNVSKNNQETKHHFKELDKILIEKALVMIQLSEEPNISDETFEEPVNLNFDTDEELSDETFKESSDELLKESTDADIEISS